jgi:gamma-glutamyltranspeptidase / glutathione hydrolase
MVVTASREASAAGAAMLEQGGNAIDAAVAATFALGVASPGLAGVAGQTYILLHLADGRDLAIDGSCRAPYRVRAEEMQGLTDATGSYYGWKSVATPGTIAALATALERYGTKTLAETLEPAIRIAEFGSDWSPATRVFFEKYYWTLLGSPTLCSLYLRNGIEPFEPDHLYCSPDLACFLRRLAAGGADEFYRGAIATEIEADMTANGGWVTRGDLARLRTEIKEPVRGRYRGLEVLSFPLPGRGAAVVEALGILDRFPPELLRGDTPDRLHLLIEACRLAYADSTPKVRPTRLPDDLATDLAYVASRAALIRLDRALAARELSATPLSTVQVGGTTQVSAIDDAGNLVSLTHTLGNAFGAVVATEGFGSAYNNLLGGFNYTDRRDWQYIRPYQAPMTSMAPTILLKDGAPYLAIGSAGSDKILAIIVNVVSNLVDRGLPPCEAMTAARAVWGGFPEDAVYLEMVDPITDEQADALARRGFAMQHRLHFPAGPLGVAVLGGVNAVLVDPTDGTLVGVGDPRRTGSPAAPRAGPPAGERFTLPACWRDLYAVSPAPPGAGPDG